MVGLLRKSPEKSFHSKVRDCALSEYEHLNRMIMFDEQKDLPHEKKGLHQEASL